MTERFFKLLPDSRWKSSDKFFSERSGPGAGGVQPFADAWPRGACSPSSLYQPSDEEASYLQQNIQARLPAGWKKKKKAALSIISQKSHLIFFS